MRNFKGFFLFALLLLTFTSCKDFDDVVETTDDLGNIRLLMSNLNNCSHTLNEPLVAFYCAADVGSSYNNGFAIWDISLEPRTEYRNTSDYNHRYPVENYYVNLYTTLTMTNRILVALEKNEGLVSDPSMYKAISFYAQAYTLGHLGLCFDKGFVVTDKTVNSQNVDLVSYSVMIDSAIAICDKAIAICNASSFTLPKAWLPTNTLYTNVELSRLVNTLAASLLTYKSRNSSQNIANDWARILTYAQNGIQVDYSPIMDDDKWSDYYKYYSTWASMAIDMRVISMMDPAMYPWFPASGNKDDLPNGGVATSVDARLDSDFEYTLNNNLYPIRGIYLYSTYRYKRYDYYQENGFIGELPTILAWENEMIKAEALVRTGHVDQAAANLNSPTGPRKVRGELPDVSTTDQNDVLNAIYYEKTIECMLSTEMTEFYDMRRRDMLQAGTPLHLPIPAQQLEVNGIPLYTFGGTTGVPGVDYSTGGWETKGAFYNKSTYGY